MGFGSSFCHWIRLLYTNVKSAVQVNGFLSGFFPVFRGVRQGCPLSPLLYVLVAETLACSIRADTSLNGLYLPASMLQMKISQYADDTSVVVVDDYSIDRLFCLFKNYSNASGAKLNVSKCHGLWLGPWRNGLDSAVAVNWTTVSIKALGTILGPSIKPERWETPLAKITHTISSWSSRLLSLTGKVTVLNNLVLSQLWYLLTVFVLPTSIVNQINRLLGSFIRDNKTPLVARSTLELRRHQGGFGLYNVQLKMAALHAIWVRRMMATDAGKWTFFFRHYLRKAFLAEPVLRVFGFPSHSPASLRKLPPFYRSIVSSWHHVGGCHHSDGSLAIVHAINPSPITIENVSATITYKVLLTFELPTPRCKLHFPSVNWSATWHSIHLCRFIRSTLDTAWKIAHGVLPTADRLLRFRMQHVQPNCFCGQIETADHLFFSCPIASRLWFWFPCQAHQYCRDFPPLSPAAVRFGFPRSSAVPKGFQMLMHIIKHFLFLHRNQHRFDNATSPLK